MRFRDPDPHRLPTIIEDDEEDEEEEEEGDSDEDDSEDDTSDAETIRPSTFWLAAAQSPSHPRLPADAGFDWSSSAAYQSEYREFPHREPHWKSVSPSLVSKPWLWTLVELMDSFRTVWNCVHRHCLFSFSSFQVPSGWLAPKDFVLGAGAKSWAECLLAVLSAGIVGRAFLWASSAAFGVLKMVTCDQTRVFGRTCGWTSCRDAMQGSLLSLSCLQVSRSCGCIVGVVSANHSGDASAGVRVTIDCSRTFL
ncbi:hypothetical protein BC827DRAFT_910308 [Russula dissimulans]|nr:hypothetical protein BC827DRAFT_910308 [Russula dissimulans]